MPALAKKLVGLQIRQWNAEKEQAWPAVLLGIDIVENHAYGLAIEFDGARASTASDGAVGAIVLESLVPSNAVVEGNDVTERLATETRPEDLGSEEPAV